MDTSAKTTTRQSMLSSGKGAIYIVGVTSPFWLFVLDLLISLGLGRPGVVSYSAAYCVWSGGFVVALWATWSARTPVRIKVLLSICTVMGIGLSYLCVIIFSLALIGPINPG